ncbi:substrate-binding periplasmic protein [Agarivorans sp. QJM3NY_33]|uniref:substrate-binding periplasmic protein n=1 Tax=Agarivorans sp. QJM3NY_33 TaxID=3421432 RepID=UPI003D7C5DA9
MRLSQYLFLLLVALSPALTSAATPALSYITEEAFPFNYTDERGQLQGISVELLRLTWQVMGEPEQEIRVMPWARAYYLMTQKPDIVLFSTARTSKREPYFKWACPIDRIKVVIFGPKNTAIKITHLNQFKSSMIAAMRTDVGEQLLLNHSFDDHNIKLTNNYRQLIRLLLSKRVEYISGVETIIRQAAIENQLPLDAYEVKWLLQDVPLCYAFNRTISDHFIERFQTALLKILDSPRYSEILKKYQSLRAPSNHLPK